MLDHSVPNLFRSGTHRDLHQTRFRADGIPSSEENLSYRAGPFFKPTIDWRLEEPKRKPIEKVREIRDEIERLVQKLITEN